MRHHAWMSTQPDSTRDTVDPPTIGLMPAAGSARRLGSHITTSKELLSLGGQPAYVHLLDAFASGGIDHAVIVVRRAKSDLLASIKSDRSNDPSLEPIVIESSPSELHSVVRGLEEYTEATVALGYPDILFHPQTAYGDLLAKQQEEHADLVLGLFPFPHPEKVDMVALDKRGKPREIVIKQKASHLRYAWAIAVWTGSFSRYLMSSETKEQAGGDSPEQSVGDVIQQALQDGFAVDCVIFEDGGFLDIGTREDLARARAMYAD